MRGSNNVGGDGADSRCPPDTRLSVCLCVETSKVDEIYLGHLLSLHFLLCLFPPLQGAPPSLSWTVSFLPLSCVPPSQDWEQELQSDHSPHTQSAQEGHLVLIREGFKNSSSIDKWNRPLIFTPPTH